MNPQSPTSISAETTTTTLSVSIPAEFSQYRGLVARLEAEGVAVAELRPMPDADTYGAGVEVVLRSNSSGQAGTPQDTMGSALVFRAAVLAKMAGTKIDAVGVAYLKPSGQIVFASVVPIDRAVDASWYGAPGLTLAEVAQRVRAEVSAKLASSPFKLAQVKTTRDPDGTQVLWATFTVASIAVANDSINDPGNAVGDAVYSLNAQDEAKIGVMRVQIDTAAGEPVLWVFTDIDLQTGTAWVAPGITNLSGPRPEPITSSNPTVSTTTSTAP